MTSDGEDAIFQRLKYGSKIIEILQKCCCSVDFPQEIAFNHLVKANEVLITDI